MLYIRKSLTKQAAGGFHVDLFCLAQLLHGGGLGLRRDGSANCLVDHGLETLQRQAAQILEILLPDVPQEGGDLGIVHHACQRNALPGGEDQGMKPHGDHCLHSGQSADDGPGAACVV